MQSFRSRAIRILFIVVSLIIVHCSLCFALRPLYTEVAWTTSINKLVLESGTLLWTNRDNTGDNEFITSLKYGFARDFDGSLDLPYMSRYSPEGNFDGIAYGKFKLKYNFYNSLGIEGASFLFGYQVDSENQSISSDPSAHDITTMLIYSLEMDPFSLHFNFGYTFDDEPLNQPHNDFILYNTAIVKPITDTFNIMGELQYTINTYTSTKIAETAIGCNYEFNDSLTFDTALGCGLNEDSSSSNFSFGLTYIFNLFGGNE